MTSDERLDRIEHIAAGIAEERRQDREQARALWRDTQRQITELGFRIRDLAEESRAADQRLEDRIQQHADEARAANKALEQRIADLVSALGEHLRQGHPQQ
jgi:hypothetical protein